jgi:hypothetical protein
MIGMNDDTRFLGEIRRGQLLAEAEARRLVEGTSHRDRDGGLMAAIHRLGDRLFGAGDRTQAVALVDTLPAPVAIATGERTKSGGEPCSGSHTHRQIAA